MNYFKLVIITSLCLVMCCVNACNKDEEDTSGTCFDGIKNQNEVGIDCGGFCTACITATCTDNFHNGDETGIDCGGSCDPCGNFETKISAVIDGINFFTTEVTGAKLGDRIQFASEFKFGKKISLDIESNVDIGSYNIGTAVLFETIDLGGYVVEEGGIVIARNHYSQIEGRFDFIAIKYEFGTFGTALDTVVASNGVFAFDYLE